MPRADQQVITFKKGVVEAIDRFIADNRYGYTSRSEVATAAIREFLRRHEESDWRASQLEGAPTSDRGGR